MSVESFGSSEFDWGSRKDRSLEVSAPYLALVKHGSEYADLNDPESHEQNVVVLANLPSTEEAGQNREDQIKEVILKEVAPQAFPDSEQFEVTKIRAARTKQKVLKRVIETADQEEAISNVIELSGGGVVLVTDKKQAS